MHGMKNLCWIFALSIHIGSAQAKNYNVTLFEEAVHILSDIDALYLKLFATRIKSITKLEPSNSNFFRASDYGTEISTTWSPNDKTVQVTMESEITTEFSDGSQPLETYLSSNVSLNEIETEDVDYYDYYYLVGNSNTTQSNNVSKTSLDSVSEKSTRLGQNMTTTMLPLNNKTSKLDFGPIKTTSAQNKSTKSQLNTSATTEEIEPLDSMEFVTSSENAISASLPLNTTSLEADIFDLTSGEIDITGQEKKSTTTSLINSTTKAESADFTDNNITTLARNDTASMSPLTITSSTSSSETNQASMEMTNEILVTESTEAVRKPTKSSKSNSKLNTVATNFQKSTELLHNNSKVTTESVNQATSTADTFKIRQKRSDLNNDLKRFCINTTTTEELLLCVQIQVITNKIIKLVTNITEHDVTASFVKELREKRNKLKGLVDEAEYFPYFAEPNDGDSRLKLYMEIDDEIQKDIKLLVVWMNQISSWQEIVVVVYLLLGSFVMVFLLICLGTYIRIKLHERTVKIALSDMDTV